MLSKKEKKPSYNQFERFELIKPIEGGEVPVGYIGVVLDVYDDNPPAYEVEFPDESGCNIGSEPTFTLTEDYMKKIS